MNSSESMEMGMRKSVLDGKKRNRKRLAFTRFLIREYGMNMQTAYGKLRRNLIKDWEMEGISSCIASFQSDYQGEVYDFWKKCRRLDFCRFMEARGMSENTVRKRFTLQNFTRLEIDGLNAAYARFKAAETVGNDNHEDEGAVSMSEER